MEKQDVITVNEFNRILINLLINSPLACGNEWCIRLDDVDITKIYDYLLLWDNEKDNIFNIAGNKCSLIINGESLTSATINNYFMNLVNKES